MKRKQATGLDADSFPGATSCGDDTLVELLDRLLNTGVVLVGDVIISVKLCDVELLSIQLRLLICSVEKAQELGIPWWWEQHASSDHAVSRTDGRHKALPESESPTHTPWEEYRRFQEYQRFREAQRAFEG